MAWMAVPAVQPSLAYRAEHLARNYASEVDVRFSNYPKPLGPAGFRTLSVLRSGYPCSSKRCPLQRVCQGREPLRRLLLSLSFHRDLSDPACGLAQLVQGDNVNVGTYSTSRCLHLL